ncbi:uncharacterized protein LOC143361700 [Halictus rubicundus]|uniref:uncharacterized protein LOC143361700 n=1 Tax=Halictus rubicundus TaxID=77578 RepID=UPI004036172F
MFENVSPDKAMAFVRLSIALICGWPLPTAATKAQVLCLRIAKVLSALSALALFFPVLNAAILYVDDFAAFSKAVVMAISALQVFFFTLLCTAKHDDFQRLIEDIRVTLKNAKSYERNVFQRYIDTYSMFYGLTVIWYYVSPMVVVVGSIFLPQPFPTISEYPFRVDYAPVRIIIFLHQAIVGFQCSASVSLNMFAALFLLYTAAKYEILMIDMREAASVDAFMKCMKKYHAVKRFAKDVIAATQYIACITILCSSTNIVLCGLNIIGRQSFVVKLQFVVLSWTGLMEVFMCALPADSLINVSTNAVRSVYESTWYDQALEVQKTVLRMIVPQKPMAISFKCFIPVLCLEYYCSVPVQFICKFILYASIVVVIFEY